MSASAAPLQEISSQSVHNILISQAKPLVLTAYEDLEKRFGVRIDFVPFVTIEGLTEKEYRKNRVYRTGRRDRGEQRHFRPRT